MTNRRMPLHHLPRISWLYSLTQEEFESCCLTWRALVDAGIDERIRKRIVSRMYHRYAALAYRRGMPYSYAPDATNEILKDPALFIEFVIRSSMPCALEALPAIVEEPL